jgi:RNA polymerase sigma-70 factor, ECF subfamily
MSADEPLESLMARYVAGDLHAFDALYARISPRVFGYLASMTRDPTRAEDLCQTAFLKIHRGRSGWIPGSPVLPWVMAITRNTFHDSTRRSKAEIAHVTKTGEVPDVPDLDAEEGRLAIEMEADGADLGHVLADAIASLPLALREALALTKQGGMAHRDAAVVLGTTEMAVKLRVHRAYKALREILREHRDREGRP